MSVSSENGLSLSLDRRQLLQGLVLTGSAMLLGRDRGPRLHDQALDDIADFPRHRFDERAPHAIPGHERLAVSSNPRLIRGLGKHTEAFVVVHAGFLETQTNDFLREYGDLTGPSDPEWNTIADDADSLRTFVGLQDGEQGDYGAYLASMRQLLAHLRTTDTPVLSYVEARDLHNDTMPRPELAPPDNAFLMVTEKSDADLVPTVECRGADGQVRTMAQRPELMLDSLRRAGVKRLLVAGEYGLNPWSGFPACLGTVAERLMDDGFEVQGIAGAVFPSRPSGRSSLSVAAALHDNSVPLERIIQG